MNGLSSHIYLTFGAYLKGANLTTMLTVIVDVA
jgi:hypothetical protein